MICRVEVCGRECVEFDNLCPKHRRRFEAAVKKGNSVECCKSNRVWVPSITVGRRTEDAAE